MVAHFRRILLIFTTVAWLLPVVVRADADLRPSWVGRPTPDLPANYSFLQASLRNSSLEPDPRDEIYDPTLVLQLKQQYADLMRDYEMRAKYGLVDTGYERAHADQVNNFARDVVHQIQRYHVNIELRKVRLAAERNKTLRAAKKPIAVAGVLVSAYSGDPMNIPVGEQTRLTTITDIRGQKGRLALESPAINGAFDLAPGVPSQRDPAAPPPADPTQRDERYRFSFSRALPIWSLSSGISYGSTSSTLSASVSKPLSAHMTCVLDTIQPLSPDTSDVKMSQETVKLLYGIQF